MFRLGTLLLIGVHLSSAFSIQGRASTVCSNVFSLTNAWDGGWQGNVLLNVQLAITSWTVVVTLSSPVTSFAVPNAVSTTSDNKVFTLTSYSWSGTLPAGVQLSVQINLSYLVGTVAPEVTSVKFNGLEVCSGASSNTTTAKPTTTSTTTSKSTTTTTTAKPTTTSTTTAKPSTTSTTTAKPSTTSTTTAKPSTTSTTTAKPSTTSTTTAKPSTTSTTTAKPSTTSTTTAKPTTLSTTTAKPTTASTTTAKPTTTSTTTAKPTTTSTTTAKPTTTSTTTAKPTTTSTTTAKPSTTAANTNPTTTNVATTASSGSLCSSILTFTNSWDGGWQGDVKFTVPTALTSWTMVITFSAPVTTFNVYNSVATTSDNTVFTLTSYSWSGVVAAGAVLDTQINIYYPAGAAVPNVVGVTFNGQQLCTGGGSSVTTTTIQTSSTAAALTSSTTSKSAVTTASTTNAGTVTTTKPVSTVSPASTVSPGLATKYNYTDVLYKSLLFYEAQRSGKLPSGNRISYRGDSALGDIGQNGESLTGGYYDAGDFVKFGFPMASTVTILAWSMIDYLQGYSAAGQVQYGLDAVKWGTDYFIKAHVTANQLYAQVGDGNADHSYWGRPEQMTMARPSSYISTSAPGSDLAGETAAALAAASIVFKTADPTYSSTLLTHAQQLYLFAKTYQGKYSDSVSAAAGFYPSSSYGDELAWAAAWLYRATGTASYLADAQAYYTQYGLGTTGSFSWDNKGPGVQVLLAKLTKQSTYVTALQSFCDNTLTSQKTPKGLTFISIWGSLRYSANAAYICLQAADLGINPSTYRNFAKAQIGYALGDTGRSFVVGFGTNPPTHEHHRSSSCANMPTTCDWNTYNSASSNGQILYGALVGGPDASDSYSDVRSNYQQNEVACDYNAGFQGAVAALNQLAASGVFA